MTILVAAVIALIVGAGAHLMTRSDIVKLIAGTLLLGNASVLLIASATLEIDRAPVHPIADPQTVADPLAQAMALTAIVIGFGTTVLLLRIALAIERSHDTIQMDDLVSAEVAEGEAGDREGT